MVSRTIIETGDGMIGKALFIGNSDGIGLAATGAMLGQGWQVLGISRSASPIENPAYTHRVADVRDPGYPSVLGDLLQTAPAVDVCLYCTGIGELLDPCDMQKEIDVFEVNLMGMVKTAAAVVPAMVTRGAGHFIGLSSMADAMISAEAPSYHASKAAFSNYLEGLALALRPKGVNVTNVRFGFVDTKMAKGEVKPFMMSVDRAVRHLLACIEKRPPRYTAPWMMTPLVHFRDWMLRLNLAFGRSAR